MPATQPQRITEVKRTLDGRTDRFVCDLLARNGDRLVLLFRLPGARDVHGVRLPAGTVTIAYFWLSRSYNLYHWIGPDGGTVACYFNVGDVTRVEPGELEWLDLAVDILATPGSAPRVLDEDELPPDLDPNTRRYVEQARDEVLRDLDNLIAEAERESSGLLAQVPFGSASS